MEFRLLGVLEALDEGLPISLGGPKQRSVLAMLLLDANRAVSTDRLVDGLWGDDPPLRAAATLQVYVSNLRKALEPDRSRRAEPSVLLTQAPGYLLAVDPDCIDLFRFEQLAAVARSLAVDGCAAGASVLFQEALALWREAPLADLAGEEFAQFEIGRLEELRVGVLEDRIDADLALGRDVELLPELDGLVARHPYRERLRRQYILALYRASQQAEALAAFQAARKTLVDDLGLEPSRDLRELEAAILVQDPDLDLIESTPMDRDAVRHVLTVCCRAEPDPATLEEILSEGRTSARRVEEALRRAIDRARTARLSEAMNAATTTRRALDRSQRAIADDAFERRARHALPSRRAMRAVRAADASPCPYKGLLRFEPEDTDWYFGRERLVADLIGRVASARAVGIVGASGSGKSSLTRAGLVAALRDDALPESNSWPQLLITPGSDPVLELSRALAPVSHASSPELVRDQLLDDPESVAAFASRAVDGRKGTASVLIVVDQLEEVFTVCRDEALRDRFLDALVAAAADPDAPTRVVAAIRADYFGLCASHAAFAELLGGTSVLVGPMRPDEVQRAIVEPARLAGLELEDGLVDRILDDVGTEPGALPLLETALLETWDRRTGNTMTLESYEAAGGVRGAVAHLAEEVFGRMSANERELARGILLRLSEPGVAGDDVRRRAALDELLVDHAHAAVLSNLVEHRLVVTSDSTAEVAHEALLREWPRLREWLDEDREGRRVQRALAIAAHDWSTRGTDDDVLFRGSRLSAALDVADAHPADINTVEREFLAASRVRQDRELHDARRSARRLRALLAATVVLLVVAIAAGSLSLVQRGQARDRARAAELARLSTHAATLPDEFIGRALLLGVEAGRLEPSERRGAALLAALAHVPVGLERLIGVQGGIGYSGVSPDGQRFVTAGDDGKARIVSVSSGRVLRTLEPGTSGGTNGGVGIASFSPDGRLVVISTIFEARGTIRIFDAENGRQIGRGLRSGTGIVIGQFVPNDSTRLITVSADELVQWDLSDPERPRRIKVPFALSERPNPQQVTLLAISPDGRTVATSAAGVNKVGAQGTTFVWDLESGARMLGPLSGRPTKFTADGSQLILRQPDRIAFVDAYTGAKRGALKLGFSPGTNVVVSTDGQRLAVSDEADGAMRVFDLNTGQQIGQSLTLFTGFSYPMAFLPDDRLLVASTDEAAVWRYLDGAPAFATLLSGDTGNVEVRFASEGNEVITFDDVNHQVLGLRAHDGRPLGRAFDPGAPPTWPEPVSPDGSTVLVQESDGVLGLWNRRTGLRLSVLDTGQIGAVTTAWSPDGSVLATTSGNDPDVVLWDVSDVRRPREQRRVSDGKATEWNFRSPTFSPNGRVLGVNDYPELGWVTLVDVASGRVLRQNRLGGQVGAPLVYSPDGESIVTMRYAEGTLLLLDATTGEVRASRGVTGWPRAWGFVQGGRRIALQTVPSSASKGPSTLELWEATTLETFGEPVRVPGDNSQFSGAHRGGMKVVVGNIGGHAVLWDLDPRQWERLACRVAGRNLTRTEWNEYLPGRDYHRTCPT